MISQDALIALVEARGLLILAPLAMIEGPAVSIAAGCLARLGLLDPLAVLACVVLADLLGDVLVYQLGRHGRGFFGSARALRPAVTRMQLARLIVSFRRRGMRLLILGKITHYLGFATLLAAGAARMPFWRFFAAVLLATLPKSLVLIGIGWTFGEAWRESDWTLAMIVLAPGAAILAAMLCFRRKQQGQPQEQP